MALKTTRFDASKYLETPEDIAEFLTAMFEEGDVRDVALGIGTVARSIGMTDLAKKTGLTREALYKATSDDGNPTLTTLLAVLKAFGLRLQPVAVGVSATETTAAEAA